MDRPETTGAEGFLPEDDDMEDLRVTLTMEDDSEVECRILTIFEYEDQDYSALLPQDENGDDSEDAEVLLFRYFEDEDGEPSLENIEEEDEFDEISEIFLQLVEDEAWEED